jgi:hypothetical protein
MDKNVRLGAFIVIFGSLFLWIVIALAIIGGITVSRWAF